MSSQYISGFFRLGLIDNPVVPCNNFTDIVLPNFWNNSSD